MRGALRQIIASPHRRKASINLKGTNLKGTMARWHGLAASIGDRAVTDFPKIREIVVPANMEAVNAAVAEHRIEPDQIISVIVRPQRVLAIGEYEEKYRIIYRAR